MATFHAQKKKAGLCEQCGRKKKGMLIAPVTDIPGGFMIIQTLNEKFLCEEHFHDFIDTNGHEVRYER